MLSLDALVVCRHASTCASAEDALGHVVFAVALLPQLCDHLRGTLKQLPHSGWHARLTDPEWVDSTELNGARGV